MKKAPLLATLEKIAAETEQTKKALETLPEEIAVATTYKRRRPPPLASAIALTSTSDPREPYVTMADEEELGATAREPEEEVLQEVEEILQEQKEIRENIPLKYFQSTQ